jgi:type II secretory pathway pseudopilin PulG
VFNGPRHGVASWIAASAPLNSLDFMSPRSAIVEAFRLKPPAQMFDDIVEIVGPMALQALPQIEQQFNVNLKQDILSKLGGEFGFEVQTPPQIAAPAPGTPAAQPNFKLLLSVTDAAGLQQTIKRLMAESPIQAQERVEDGITFYTITPPSSGTTGQEFNYFFLDNYLVLTTNRELAREAISLHRNGGSVAKAQAQPVKASMFARQNGNLFLSSIMTQLPPDVARNLPKSLTEGDSMVTTMYGYADATSIRATTNSNMHTEAALGLIVAAVAIPNLLRSKMEANDSAARSALRTINTAQVTYNITYPRKGYAPSLAALGPGPNPNCTEGTAAHACLLDNTLGAPSCTSGQWCIKNGYKFTVRGICTPGGICSGYVATATPVTEGSTGIRSLCSTTDGVIRSHEGAVDAPLTTAACRAWIPIQ